MNSLFLRILHFLMLSAIAYLPTQAQNTWDGPGVSTTTGQIYRSGRTGLGTGFSSSVLPTNLLELRDQNALIDFSPSGQYSSLGGLNFRYGNVLKYKLLMTYFPSEGSGMFHLANDVDFGIHLATGNSSMMFGNQGWYYSGNSLDGRYRFDGQIGTTALWVSPIANSGSPAYRTMPANYRLGVNGNSYFNGDLSVGTTSPSGFRLTVNTTNYGGLQINQNNNSDFGYACNIRVDREATKAFSVTNSVLNADNFVVWGNGVVNAKKIYTEALTVRTDAIGISWPDYVFEKSYTLRPLAEVEKFIDQNKHLPEVPSANEIATNGLNTAEMDAALLKKIEELTLYMIEMKKQNDQLMEQVETQQSELNNLKSKLGY